jgi:hypothetical protein
MKAKTSFLSCLLVLIGALGAQIALAANDSGTLTAGSYSTTCGARDQYEITITGFESGITGSYSPATLTGGDSVSLIYNQTGTRGSGCPIDGAYFSVSASSDPGSTWLTSVTCNGSTLYQSGIYSYSYNAGLATATWTWQLSYFNISSGGAYGCTISHS